MKSGIWWRSGRGWYAWISGKQTFLHKSDKEEAQRLWHQLKAKERVPELQQYTQIAPVFELYLDYLEGRRSYRCSKFYLQKFKNRHPDMRVCDLRAEHIGQWFVDNPRWGETTKRHALAVLLACLTWAAKPEQRLIPSNPLRGMRKPQGRSRGREVVLSDEDWQQALELSGESLRDVLIGLRQTGARPSTLIQIEAKHCDWEHGLIILEKHKTANKTGRPLVIPMTRKMRELLQKLAERHPTGPLFRKPRGTPWTSQDVSEYVLRLRQKMEAMGIKLKGRLIAYSMRHTTATELLERGVPIERVAALLGHTSTNMILHHYGHLTAQGLRNDLEKINEGGTAGESADGECGGRGTGPGTPAGS